MASNTKCKYGNERKIKADNTLGYCGRANVCQCLKEKCALSGKKVKSKTPEEKKAISEKRRETNLTKYGVVNTCQTELAKSAREEYINDDVSVAIATAKNKATKLRNHGSENYNNLEKTTQTNIEKYGVSHPMKLDEIQTKQKETNLSRYGVEFVFQCDEFVEKYKSTMMEKYGVEYPLQSQEIVHNMRLNSLNSHQRSWPNQQNMSNDAYDKLNNKEWLTEENKKKSLTSISADLGVSETLAGKYLKKYKITPVQHAISDEEKEVLTFIKSVYSGKIITNTRDIIGLELDIYIPEKSIAIEYNGTYWHSSIYKERKYHFEKYKRCKDIGIQLVQIYDHQWKNKTEIVKSKLSSLLGISTRIFARKCKIVPINNAEQAAFLETYHIQGKSVSSVCLGLEFYGRTVAIMTFLRKRSLGNLNTDWELIRYASADTVVGGASKLFSAIVNQYDISSVVSYSLNDLHSGNLYEVLGFKLSHESGPGYWYVDNSGKQYHRYTFSKHKLVKMGADSSKTEFQITEEMGLLRYHDSGNKVWVWKR